MLALFSPQVSYLSCLTLALRGEGIYLGKIEYAITFKITWFNFKDVFS